MNLWLRFQVKDAGFEKFCEAKLVDGVEGRRRRRSGQVLQLQPGSRDEGQTLRLLELLPNEASQL